MHVIDTVIYTLTKQGGQGGCTFPMVPHGPAVSCAVKLLIQWMLYMRPCCWVAAGPKVQRPPSCVLCPVSGPPLRQTSCGRFCHVGCAQWLGETFIQGGLVHGVRHVSKVIIPFLDHPCCFLLFTVIHLFLIVHQPLESQALAGWH